MKKKTVLVFVLSLLSIITVRADEGMWLPLLLERNMATMTDKGIKLTSEQIYDINESSIKDAIVSLDHGACTGELISEKGLLLTNHHCAYGEIQYHSSVESDYLTDGFWAESIGAELGNSGLSASFLVSVEDVTTRVLQAVDTIIDEKDRKNVIRNIRDDISDEAVLGTHYEASVESMFSGNKYYLFVYETFPDVRLVGAPPESIGRFGGDVDNWEWPRHTGDFTLFRVYSDTLGKPAEYSVHNIPFESKYFLPISLDGIEEEDFAIIMGYPGFTSRYMTSKELEYVIGYENNARIKIRGIKQDIWEEDMAKSDEIRIKYSSKYASSLNDWKYSILQNRALKRFDVYEMKVEEEKAFIDWYSSDSSLKIEYGDALLQIENLYAGSKDILNAINYLYETQIWGAELFIVAHDAAPELMTSLVAGNKTAIDSAKVGCKIVMDDFFKNYNSETDKKVAKALLKIFMEDVSVELYPSYINTEITKKFKGDVDAYVDNIYEKSIFIDKERMNEFMDRPSAKRLEKDPVYIAAESIVAMLREYYDTMGDAFLNGNVGMRKYVAGVMEMYSDSLFYPDANSTMRLTYGNVASYIPGDAISYASTTTLKGLVEKDNPDVKIFSVPGRLKDIYKTKDYGIYGNADSTMTVCFITNNDISGGNSGSPVIDSEGRLIGCAFDSNSESMSGDIKFENSVQRTINLDIRYVLLIIDKFAGATHLIDEMTLIKDGKVVNVK